MSAALDSAETTIKQKPYERFWSKHDEFKILQGLAEYHSKNGTDPASAMKMDPLFNFMKPIFGFPFTKNQLGDKIRRMRRSFRTLDDSNISDPLEKEKYELSMILWGKKKYDDENAVNTREPEASSSGDQQISQLEHELETMEMTQEKHEQLLKVKCKETEKRVRRHFDFISLQQSVQSLTRDFESLEEELICFPEKCPIDVGLNVEVLTDAYHSVLAENRKLFNELQELKGKIRVYCRVKPFLSGQSRKSTIDYIGANGELRVANPSKQGKDAHRMFMFNKVFSPTVTQEEVFFDVQPLIRSVIDGYNVCVFAYGQTGSGKTYTMSGPSTSSKADLGVNYRALNELFLLSQNRKSIYRYEVGVQMIEIYNEQVHDLLSSDGSQRRLEIRSTSQPHGVAVPDASMLPVKSTEDVLELMQVGQANRAVGATTLNERNSRSHSVLTVHVRGANLKTKATFCGSLHLIDLAGSERVDRSGATGDRLKEAQHINKSLSALGDVISALAQKNNHVPYRNSKLTQVLQSSLGGQAKTLMFVHINPDVESYSETISTLKFAERVSTVELGIARSDKEGME